MPHQESKSFDLNCLFAIALISFNLLACAQDHEQFINYVPERPPLTPDRGTDNIRRFGDILRSEDKDFMDAINDPSLMAVTTELGPTVITAKTFPFRSKVATAGITPWTSFWFPKRERSLFDDSKAANAKDFNNLSTLTKFDLLKKLRNPKAPSAADYERKSFDSNSLSWEGLCDAWSIASITFPEPKKTVTYYLRSNNRNPMTFEIGDIKGLLLKTLEAVEDRGFKYYGQKFTGKDNGWIYPDIFPEQFHRLMEVQLFEKHQPFIIDIDQGVEIWNFPAYKANYTMTAMPNEPNSVYVRTWLYLADSLKSFDKNFVGTKEVIREYNYVLQGERNSNGDLVVDLGYWVKGPTGINSRSDHPDFIMIPPEHNQIGRKSWNPEIDIKLVDEIVAKSI